MASSAEQPGELTIDELAARVGLPSSTIRLYQTRGLLPAPRRQGRSAFYGPGHLARIDLIGRLQDRGFSLAAIADLVQGWEAGRSLDDVLGLEQRVPGAGIAGEEPTIRLTPAELAERFPTVPLTPAIVQRVVAMGLIEPTDDGALEVRSPAFLEVGAALVALGIPLDEVLDEADRLREQLGEVAERFAALFERHLWRPFVAAGMPAEDLVAVTDALEQLGPLADRVVHSTLQRELARVADRFLAEEAARRTS